MTHMKTKEDNCMEAYNTYNTELFGVFKETRSSGGPIVEYTQVFEWGVCSIRMILRTSGYCGGDAGHGGLFSLVFQNVDNAELSAWMLNPEGKDIDQLYHARGEKTGVVCFGDVEISLMATMLKRAGEVTEELLARANAAREVYKAK